MENTYLDRPTGTKGGVMVLKRTGNYAAWVIDQGKALLKNDSSVVVQLVASSSGVPLEGWWHVPSGYRAVISGVCIFDGSWQAEFAPQSKHNPGAKRSLALPMEREDAFTRIKKGNRVVKIHVPTDLGTYHKDLVRWQAAKFAELKPQRILYHIPVMEYQAYATELEQQVGKMLPELRRIIEAFHEKLKGFFLDALGEAGVDAGVVEFIRPMELGAVNPQESFGLPYLHPERFGLEPHEVVGVEDLAELRIALEAKRTRQHTIPVLCGVLDFSHPYCRKERNGDEMVTIVL